MALSLQAAYAAAGGPLRSGRHAKGWLASCFTQVPFSAPLGEVKPQAWSALSELHAATDSGGGRRRSPLAGLSVFTVGLDGLELTWAHAFAVTPVVNKTTQAKRAAFEMREFFIERVCRKGCENVWL